MAEFTHVLMTRFNLATPGRESALRNRPGWLAGRFELFEKYCLPSVAAQTVPRDALRWIIYFDEDTPQEFKTRVAELQKQTPFEAYYTGLFPGEGWARSINERFARETPYLLTTRLDNDDALASDFAERLHQAVTDRGYERGLYNFTNGFVAGGGALYAMEHPANPFFSAFVPWDEAPLTAPQVHHLALESAKSLHQIGGPAAWMQVIHDGNVSNKIRGRRVTPQALETGRFPPALRAELSATGSIPVMMENAFLTPVRALRDRLSKMRRAKPL